ncbi:hypothetical protein ACP4OV_025366 [Aristida adscensionis]
MACLLAVVVVIAAAVLTVPPGRLTAHAAPVSPAEAFWLTAFPDAPMPEAIRELLHTRAEDSPRIDAMAPPMKFNYDEYKASPRDQDVVAAAASNSKALEHAGARNAAAAASPTVFFLEEAVRVGESLPFLTSSQNAANADAPAAAAAPLQLYTVRAVREVEGSSFVVCRGEASGPGGGGGGAVYACREAAPARAYVVDAVGERGDAVTAAVVLCHADTSRWDPEHAAFRLLGVRPGGAAVCRVASGEHVLPANGKKSPSSA